MRRWRKNGGEALVKAFVPLKFELGEAFQFDWSEEHLVIGCVWRKIVAAHLKLTTVLLERMMHHRHTVETGNEAYRFHHSSASAKSRSKAGE